MATLVFGLSIGQAHCDIAKAQHALGKAEGISEALTCLILNQERDAIKACLDKHHAAALAEMRRELERAKP